MSRSILGLSVLSLICGATIWCGCSTNRTDTANAIRNPTVPSTLGRPLPDIRAFCVDFNWYGDGFATPGTFASADPAAQVEWYKSLGCNVIQTFCVTCDGYSWYRGTNAPVQPGLATDFLRDMVRLGHREKMRVMGYFCVGANRHWGMTRPELSRGIPSAIHIPLTTTYLDYLCAEIREAVSTRIDGFMLDWFFNVRPQGPWLQCEKQMYVELFAKEFPGEAAMTDADTTEFCRRSVERAWKRIHDATKKANPKCIIWLSSHNMFDPQQAGSSLLREVDWIMNEGPKREHLDQARRLAGPNATIIQGICGWGKEHSASFLMDTYGEEPVGFYGFAWPWKSTCLPPEGADIDFASGSVDGAGTRNRWFGNATNIMAIRDYWNETAAKHARPQRHK